MEILIYTDEEVMPTETLKERLESILEGRTSHMVFRLWKPPIRVRGMDPTVLVAVVGASGAAIGALITGLLQAAQQSSAKRIIIQTQNGSRIEIPRDVTPEELEPLIEAAKRLEAQRVFLS